MKHYLQNKLRNSFLVTAILFLTLSLSLSSCLKKSGPDSSSIVSALTVINASPDSPTLEFVLNNQRVHEFSYPDKRISYFTIFSGSHYARIYPAGNFTSHLYEVGVNLLPGKYYSLFIAGKTDNLTSLAIEDDMSFPESGNARIRFINLSSDAPALDFKLSTDSVIASNKKFKEYTSFQEVKAGQYNALIKSNIGNSINLPLELELKAGEIYTVWARGFVDTEVENQEFNYQVIVNNVQ